MGRLFLSQEFMRLLTDKLTGDDTTVILEDLVLDAHTANLIPADPLLIANYPVPAFAGYTSGVAWGATNVLVLDQDPNTIKIQRLTNFADVATGATDPPESIWGWTLRVAGETTYLLAAYLATSAQIVENIGDGFVFNINLLMTSYTSTIT